jgi:hypothetical protein
VEWLIQQSESDQGPHKSDQWPRRQVHDDPAAEEAGAGEAGRPKRQAPPNGGRARQKGSSALQLHIAVYRLNSRARPRIGRQDPRMAVEEILVIWNTATAGYSIDHNT